MMLNATTLQRSPDRFSGLILENGEYIFKRYTDVAYKPDKKSTIKGNLWLCSQSLVFIPYDVRLSTFKFPLNEITPKFNTRKKDKLFPQQQKLVCFNARICVELQKGGKITPYTKHVLEGEAEEIKLSFNTKEECADLAQRMEQLIIIGALDFHEAREELQKIIANFEQTFTFDESLITDNNEQVLVQKRGTWCRSFIKLPGIICVTNKCIYFKPYVSTSTAPSASPSDVNNNLHCFYIPSVVKVRKQTYMQMDTAIEIFFLANSTKDNTNSVFLTFKDEQERDEMYNAISSLPELMNFDSDIDMQQRWISGSIDNFEYLLYLNHEAGRTFHDIAQYPVFPWVIADYTSKVLDLNNPATFRDLSKPIGALNPDRLAQYHERMKETPPPTYLYSSHYSTPAYVIFYLFRYVPEYLLHYQGGKFDSPDRMFTSIEATWRSSLSSPTDVKELIPEFYCGDGAFLVNMYGMEFGNLQDGTLVNNAQLPPWALDPADFVQKCRAALESDYVSEHLHEWIDLIFGCKQQGEAALEANNVFHYSTYKGNVNLSEMEDPLERQAAETRICEFGQTPRQLFTKPHPKRCTVRNQKMQEMVNEMASLQDKVAELEQQLQQMQESSAQDIESLKKEHAKKERESTSLIDLLKEDIMLKNDMLSSKDEVIAQLKSKFRDMDTQLREVLRLSTSTSTSLSNGSNNNNNSSTSPDNSAASSTNTISASSVALSSKDDISTNHLRLELRHEQSLRKVAQKELDEAKKMEKLACARLEAVTRELVSNKDRLKALMDENFELKSKMKTCLANHKKDLAILAEQKEKQKKLEAHVRKLTEELEELRRKKESNAREIRSLKTDLRQLGVNLQFLDKKVQETEQLRDMMLTTVVPTSPIMPPPSPKSSANKPPLSPSRHHQQRPHHQRSSAHVRTQSFNDSYNTSAEVVGRSSRYNKYYNNNNNNNNGPSPRHSMNSATATSPSPRHYPPRSPKFHHQKPPSLQIYTAENQQAYSPVVILTSPNSNRRVRRSPRGGGGGNNNRGQQSGDMILFSPKSPNFNSNNKNSNNSNNNQQQQRNRLSSPLASPQFSYSSSSSSLAVSDPFDFGGPSSLSSDSNNNNNSSSSSTIAIPPQQQ